MNPYEPPRDASRQHSVPWWSCFVEFFSELTFYVTLVLLALLIPFTVLLVAVQPVAEKLGYRMSVDWYTDWFMVTEACLMTLVYAYWLSV